MSATRRAPARGLAAEVEVLQIDPAQFADAVLAEFDWKIEPERFLACFSAWPTGVYPGTIDMIRRIPPRYRRALLSNSNVLHWPRILHEMGLGALFERCFASHLMRKIKPDAEAFQHALEQLACRAAQVMFLDDNALNVDAARKLGLHAALVRGADGALRALQNAGVVEPSEWWLARH